MAAGNAATLQIRINVDDNGTVQLEQINKSLGSVDASARKAAGGLAAFDQLGIRSAQQIRAELAANRAAYDQIKASGTASAQDISRAYTALQNKAKELSGELKQTQQATGGLSEMVSGKLLPALAGIATIGTAKQVIGMADEMSVLSSKVGLATGSMEEQRAVQQQLYAMSQATRSEIGVNANAFFGFSSALKSTGASSKDVLGVLDMVNKSLKISGATSGEASSFVLQFKQALGSGVLQGDEFRSMTENNVVFARALAEALNTDVTGLRAMSSQGELTTRKLAELFPQMAEKISASFDKIPVTVEGATTQIENAFKMALAGANETTGGTNKLATQISSLAVIVQENAPAIGALFNGVMIGAQGFVRLGSFIVGTFETLASAATASYGVIFKVGQALEWVTDRIGITDQTTQFWAANAEAAFASAGDLATKAGDNYNRMTRSTAEAEKAQKDWLKSLQGGSAAVLADIDAQKKREQEHAGSVQNMSKAEKKAADERAKVLDEMHKAIGGEEFYRREVDKVLAHVEVLKKAGATQEQQAQYTYEKIADLSAQAWKKGETAAGEYLDQLKGTMAGSVDLETAAQAKREAVQAASLDKMAKAEKKAADENVKIADEMYKGIGGEAFYRREADNALAYAEVLERIGATEQEQAQYTYGKISELSAQAWERGETAAAKYLDSLKATMASAAGVTAEASKAQSDAIIKAFELTGAGAKKYFDIQNQKLIEQRDQVIALTGDSLKANQWYAAEVEKLKAKTSSPVTVKVDADASQFGEKAASSAQQAAALAATTATVKMDADVSSFSSGVAEVESQINRVKTLLAEGMGGAGGQVALSPQALAGSSVLLDPFGRMRAIVEAIERGETTLSFMGETINLSSYKQQGSYAGGGYTWDGPRSGGVDGLGGRQVLLHSRETVIDHLKPDRAAIVSLYDQFVGSQQRGAAASSASPAAAAAAGEAPINIGTLIIQQATDVDGIMREIRRRAVRS